MKPVSRRSRADIKAFLFFSFLLLCVSLNAQELQKQSEKYMNAYKKYLNAACPVVKDSISYFVYFARDREAIIDHAFLTHPRFKGAQIMYSWKDLEPQKDQYDFSMLKEDYEYLKSYGKKDFYTITGRYIQSRV